MADSKITALTALTAADPTVDMFPVVDVSDTTMAASGTTKRISINNILACSPSATLASATITGALTAGGNVGFGTTNLTSISGYNTLKINNATNGAIIDLAQGDAYKGRLVGNSGGLQLETSGSLAIVLSSGGVAQYRVGTLGVFDWYDGAGGTRMTLNATGLLVGTNNTSYGAAGRGVVMAGGSTSALFGIRVGSTDIGYLFGDATKIEIGYPAAGTVSWNNGAPRMTLDATGQVGIGVTPAGTGGCLQLKSGITFPATQVASSDANTLDDYEEGSFTPAIEGQTTAGTGTYSIQVGRYTKIGNLVTVQIHLNWTAHTGTGNMLVSGLPFTSSGVGNLVGSASIGYIDNLALSAGNVPLAYVLNANTRIQLVQTPTGGGSITLVPMDTAATIVITATYMV